MLLRFLQVNGQWESHMVLDLRIEATGAQTVTDSHELCQEEAAFRMNLSSLLALNLPLQNKRQRQIICTTDSSSHLLTSSQSK